MQGFTLIELVVVLGIVAIMLSLTYSSLSNIFRSKQLLDDSRELRMIANSLLGRVSRELQLASTGQALMPPRDNLTQVYPSKTNLMGEEKQLANGRFGDTITFLAMEGGQYLPDGGTHSGLVQITYRVEPDPEQSGGPDATYYLVREESPYLRPFTRAYERTMIFPLTRSLVSLRFSYYDSENRRWVSNWGKDSLSGLPQMIQFAVELTSPAGQVKSYSTVVPLRSEE